MIGLLVGPAWTPDISAALHTTEKKVFLKDYVPAPSKALLFGYGVSIPILGSRDRRWGLTAAYQWTKAEKRLTLNHTPLSLVLEANGFFTQGGGPGRFRNIAWSGGGMFLIRYERMSERGIGFFFEGGLGFNYASHRSLDQDTHLNFAPGGGFGWLFQHNGHTMQVTVRYVHFSNAGTNRPNLGQNQLYVMAGLRF